MRRGKLLHVLCAALLAALVLAGCGASPEEAAKANFVGTWELESMVNQGQESTSDDIALLKAFGMNVYLTVNDDGTAEIEMFGTPVGATWTAKDQNTITLSLDATAADAAGIEDEEQDATFADDRVSMESGGVSMTFKKIDPSQKGEASDLSELLEDSDADAGDAEKPASEEGSQEFLDLAVGESAEVDEDVTITVNEVETDLYNYNDDTYATRVNVTYRNAGSASIERGPSNWRCEDADGTELGTVDYPEAYDALISASLDAGESATGNLYFPAGVARIGYYANDSQDQPTATWIPS